MSEEEQKTENNRRLVGAVTMYFYTDRDHEVEVEGVVPEGWIPDVLPKIYMGIQHNRAEVIREERRSSNGG